MCFYPARMCWYSLCTERSELNGFSLSTKYREGSSQLLSFKYPVIIRDSCLKQKTKTKTKTKPSLNQPPALFSPVHRRSFQNVYASSVPLSKTDKIAPSRRWSGNGSLLRTLRGCHGKTLVWDRCRAQVSRRPHLSALSLVSFTTKACPAVQHFVVIGLYSRHSSKGTLNLLDKRKQNNGTLGIFLFAI